MAILGFSCTVVITWEAFLMYVLAGLGLTDPNSADLFGVCSRLDSQSKHDN